MSVTSAGARSLPLDINPPQRLGQRFKLGDINSAGLGYLAKTSTIYSVLINRQLAESYLASADYLPSFPRGKKHPDESFPTVIRGFHLVLQG